MPHAARLAELFKAEFDFDTDFIKGDGGILEVKFEGQLVWTNRETPGTKATNEEARAALQGLLNRQ
ncbi:MAG: hypothetical protein ACKVQS_14905 [Fimbriimonadaceae bacterium]